MRNVRIVLAVALCLCAALAVYGQAPQVPVVPVAAVPQTELELFEAQTGTVIVAGSGLVGTLMLDGWDIQVISKESLNVTSGRRQYGLVIDADGGKQQGWKKVVDYDEMDSLINGLNYLGKVDYKVTAEPTFVASYVTRSGLQVGAFTSQRRGVMQYFLKDSTANSPRISISSSQLAQFHDLMDEARRTLDSMKPSAR